MGLITEEDMAICACHGVGKPCVRGCAVCLATSIKGQLRIGIDVDFGRFGVWPVAP